MKDRQTGRSSANKHPRWPCTRVPPGALFRYLMQAMVEAGITEYILRDAVAKANLKFRPGHGELLRWVDQEGVPLLMFSAGIAGACVRRACETGVAGVRVPYLVFCEMF